jgi:putative endonuclease
VRTRSGTLYTGVSTDVERRVAEHALGRGARYLRARAPLSLAYSVPIGERGLALKAEHRLRTRRKADKERIIAAAPPREIFLAWLGLGDAAPPRR